MLSDRTIRSRTINTASKWLLWILIKLVLGLILFATVSSAESKNDTLETGDPVALEPVVVTATRTPQRLKDTPVITNLITRAEIEATGAENIGEVLEHTAGIIIHRDGHGDGVQLQGLDSEYVLILVDGEPQVGRIAGKLDMARLAVENVERIEIVKGATASLFGNAALGGVINVITRKATTPFSVQELTLGGEVILENLQSERITGGERGLFTNSLFAQNVFRPISALALVIGGRLDNHSEFGVHLSPKLSAMYRVTDNLRARASYGQGFRAPDFKNLYLDFTNVTSGYQVLGNPSLQPESSHNYNLGLEYQVFNGLLTRIHMYRNDLQNLIEAERIGKSAAGGSKFEYQNISRAYTEGVDVETVIGSIGGFTSAIGYAYLRGADKETGLPLLNRSTHSGTLKLAYLHSNSGVQVDLRGRYASQWGFFDDGDKVLEPEELAPSYWVWNLRASKTLFKIFKASIGCNNIFDFKMPTFYTFTGRSFYGGLSLTY